MSGVLLVSYLNRIREKHAGSLYDVVIKGSMVQIKPVFLIMLIAIIGLLPAALNTGVGSDVQRPLATVIVGGLFMSLLITVFITPVLYFLTYRNESQVNP